MLRADDIPIHSSCLLEDFGYTRDAITVDAVTSYTYNPSMEMDEHAKLFLKCIQYPARVPGSTMSDRFTIDNYVTRWKLSA